MTFQLRLLVTRLRSFADECGFGNFPNQWSTDEYSPLNRADFEPSAMSAASRARTRRVGEAERVNVLPNRSV